MDNIPCYCPYLLSCFCGERLYVIGFEASTEDGTVVFTMCPECDSKWKLYIKFEKWLSEE